MRYRLFKNSNWLVYFRIEIYTCDDIIKWFRMTLTKWIVVFNSVYANRGDCELGKPLNHYFLKVILLRSLCNLFGI